MPYTLFGTCLGMVCDTAPLCENWLKSVWESQCVGLVHHIFTMAVSSWTPAKYTTISSNKNCVIFSQKGEMIHTHGDWATDVSSMEVGYNLEAIILRPKSLGCDHPPVTGIMVNKGNHLQVDRTCQVDQASNDIQYHHIYICLYINTYIYIHIIQHFPFPGHSQHAAACCEGKDLKLRSWSSEEKLGLVPQHHRRAWHSWWYRGDGQAAEPAGNVGEGWKKHGKRW